MKTILVIILFPVLGVCQGFLPRWEMSVSGDVNSYSNSNGSTWYAALAFRPGLFIDYGFSVEPELFCGVSKGNSNAENISGNLCYNYGMGYSVVVPFVLVGYGIGNGVPFNQPLRRETDNSTGVSLVNAGGGLKIMALGGRALLRAEYQYQSFTVKYTNFTDHIHANRLLLGFSVLL